MLSLNLLISGVLGLRLKCKVHLLDGDLRQPIGSMLLFILLDGERRVVIQIHGRWFQDRWYIQVWLQWRLGRWLLVWHLSLNGVKDLFGVFYGLCPLEIILCWDWLCGLANHTKILNTWSHAIGHGSAVLVYVTGHMLYTLRHILLSWIKTLPFRGWLGRRIICDINFLSVQVWKLCFRWFPLESWR